MGFAAGANDARFEHRSSLSPPGSGRAFFGSFSDYPDCLFGEYPALLCLPTLPRVSSRARRVMPTFGLGRDSEADPLVRAVCETRLLPAQIFTALAVQLEKAGRAAQARRVVRHAMEVDPLNPAALVMVLRGDVADRELGGSLEWIERPAGMRKPSADLLAGLGKELESDRYLFLPKREEAQAAILARR